MNDSGYPTIKFIFKHLFTFLFSSCLLGDLACAKSILIIGDSLSCGPFGKHLVEDLTKQDNQVDLYCAVSSTPQNWISGKSPRGQKCETFSSANLTKKPCGGTGDTPALSSLLKMHAGAEVMVGLGTNSLLSPNADLSYAKMSKMIASAGSKCDWIGPPRLNPNEAKGFPKSRVEAENKNVNPFYDSLAESIQNKCSLIDSRDDTAPGTPGNETVDGVHRNDAAGKYWAQAVSSKLNEIETEPQSRCAVK